jgi:hypothetical protein
MSIIKYLQELNINKDVYLREAKQAAKRNGYDPNKLKFSTDKDSKLEYDNIKFGANKYNDYIIYKELAKQNIVDKDVPQKRRQSYLARSTKIKGNWKNNKTSKNNLAINILW